MEYFKEDFRGYGGNVIEVFHQLRDENFEDVFGPASRQFGGTGSYGNGAAMRIAPAAVYGRNMQARHLNASSNSQDFVA